MLLLCNFVLFKKNDIVMKKHRSTVTFFFSLVGILFIVTTYSSCRFFNNTINDPSIKELVDTEEQQIARFLVGVTNINFKIIELSQFAQQENVPNELKNFFTIQENKVIEIQKHINKIAANKLVTLPQYNENNNTLHYFDSDSLTLTKKLIEKLEAEIVLFNKVKVQTKNKYKEISSFQIKYLPEIVTMLEETKTFNVQLYNIN